MAKVILETGEKYIASSSATIFGNVGTEVVTVQDGVPVTVDANVERIEFSNVSSAYTYKSTTTGIQVINNGVVQANLSTGQKLVFTDGYAFVNATFVNGALAFTLGKQTIGATETLMTTSLLNSAADSSSSALSTIKLTASVKTVTGTTGNDVISAHIDSNGTGSTIFNDSTINAGDGTDTLLIDVTGNLVGTLPTAAINDVEVISLHDTVNGVMGTYDFTTLQGNFNTNPSAKTVVNNVSTNDVSFKVTAGTKITVLGDGVTQNANTTFNDATEITLKDGVTGGSIIRNATGGTTFVVNSIGADNVADVLDLDTATALTSLTINATTNLTSPLSSDYAVGAVVTILGSATTVDLSGSALPAEIRKVDASSFPGGIKVKVNQIDKVADTQIIGGQGNDVIDIGKVRYNSANLTVDGKAGTNTLKISDQDVLNDVSVANISNFTRLEMYDDDDSVVDAFDVSLLKGITTLQLDTDSSGDGYVLNNISTSQALNVVIAGNQTVAPTFNIKNASLIGNIDTLALKIDAGSSASAVTVSGLSAVGVENVNVNAVSNFTATTLTGLTSLATLTVTGRGDVNLITDKLPLNLNSTINANAATGVLTVNASLATTNGISVRGSSSKANFLTGSEQNDVLTGGASADVINGGGGSDTLNGGAGDDVLNGGAGSDVINGGAGADTINGGAGVDTLNGGNGDDVFIYEASTDLFDKNALIDKISGGFGTNSLLLGKAGAAFAIDVKDLWTGASGINALVGAASATADTFTLDKSAESVGVRLVDLSQNTALTGNKIDVSSFVSTGAALMGSATGASSVLGGAGNDSILGGAGNDTLSGGAGNDVLTGGAGIDSLTGGTGVNTFVFSTGDSGSTAATADTIADLKELDIIKIGGYGTTGWSVDATGSATVGTAAINATAKEIYIDTTNKLLVIETSVDGSTKEVINIPAAVINMSFIYNYGADSIVGTADDYIIVNPPPLTSVNDGSGTLTVSGKAIGRNSVDVVMSSTPPTVNAVNVGTVAVTKLVASSARDSLNVIGSASSDSITGSDQADSISSGAGNDTIISGLGADTLDGGAGDDTFDFGTNGSLVGATDTIRNFEFVADKIKFGAVTPVLLAADNSTAIAGSNVQTNAAGLVTFAAADNTLALKIAAIQTDTQLDAINSVATFSDGADSYIYYAGAAIGNADDQIIKLEGKTATGLTLTGGLSAFGAISDTADNLAPVGIASAAIVAGVDVNVTTAATVAQLNAIKTKTATGTVTYSAISDTAANLAPSGVASTLIISGTNVNVITTGTPTPPAAPTIAQLTAIDTANGNGSLTYTAISDTTANLYGGLSYIPPATITITDSPTTAAQLKAINDQTPNAITLTTLNFSLSGSSADLVDALAGITTYTGSVTIADTPVVTIAQLKTINDATTGGITLGAITKGTSFSGSVADLKAAFTGITATLTGTITLSGTTADIADLNLIKTTLAVGGAVNASSITSITDTTNVNTIDLTTAGITWGTNISVTGGAGNDAITLETPDTAKETLIFDATAAGNGADTIANFTTGTGKDVLNFEAFLNTSGTGYYNNATSKTGAVVFDNRIYTIAKTYITDSTNGVLTTTDFATGKAFAAIGDGQKGVVIVQDAPSGAKIYYAYDSDATAGVIPVVTLVGTLTGVSGGFDATNFSVA